MSKSGKNTLAKKMGISIHFTKKIDSSIEATGDVLSLQKSHLQLIYSEVA